MPTMVTASTKHWLQLNIESLPQPPGYSLWEDPPCQMRKMATVLRNTVRSKIPAKNFVVFRYSALQRSPNFI
jgi:hypothetical protein